MPVLIQERGNGHVLQAATNYNAVGVADHVEPLAQHGIIRWHFLPAPVVVEEGVVNHGLYYLDKH